MRRVVILTVVITMLTLGGIGAQPAASALHAPTLLFNCEGAGAAATAASARIVVVAVAGGARREAAARDTTFHTVLLLRGSMRRVFTVSVAAGAATPFIRGQRYVLFLHHVHGPIYGLGPCGGSSRASTGTVAQVERSLTGEAARGITTTSAGLRLTMTLNATHYRVGSVGQASLTLTNETTKPVAYERSPCNAVPPALDVDVLDDTGRIIWRWTAPAGPHCYAIVLGQLAPGALIRTTATFSIPMSGELQVIGIARVKGQSAASAGPPNAFGSIQTPPIWIEAMP